MIRKIVLFTVMSIIFFLLFRAAPGYCGEFIIKQKTGQGITFISGGVGINERNSMKALEKDYNLKLVFANIEGEYLSEITVHINDAAGNRIIETTSNGPWFLLRLPAGTYNITSIYQGKQQKRVVSISERLEKIFFHWKI